MSGPYPPPEQTGAEPPSFPAFPPGSPVPYPATPPVPPASYPPSYPPPYPGPLPPPVSYPTPPTSRRALWWGLGGAGLAAAVVAALLVISGTTSVTGSAAFTDAAAKTAIQNYLTALSTGDTETIARNTACGMYDAIRDNKSDLALARLASDAFRKQFSSAEVTAIDKIVLSSSYQAQVLFTMSVDPRSGTRTARDEEQGVAQILRQDNRLLVCSYLLRTTAQY